MILGIIFFILSCLGIYGFYNDYYILTYIGFIFCFFENLLGRFSGASKTMSAFWLSCFIGWVIVDDFFLGISIGACFENMIMFVGGLLWIIYLFHFIKKQDSTNSEETNINNNPKKVIAPKIPIEKEIYESVNEEINNKIALKNLEENAPNIEEWDEDLENSYSDLDVEEKE